MLDLPKRIRAARRHLGQREGKSVSQEEFAARIGVTRSSVAMWETGRSRPDMDNLASVATLCAVALEWLGTGRGDMLTSASQAAREAPAGYVADPRDALDTDLVAAVLALPDRKKRALLELLRSAEKQP